MSCWYEVCIIENSLLNILVSFSKGRKSNCACNSASAHAHTIDASQAIAEHFFDKTCAPYILTRVWLSRTQEILILWACFIKKIRQRSAPTGMISFAVETYSECVYSRGIVLNFITNSSAKAERILMAESWKRGLSGVIRVETVRPAVYVWVCFLQTRSYCDLQN